MGNIYVCPQCGEEYAAAGICEMCQVDLEQANDQQDYGFHEEGEFDEDGEFIGEAEVEEEDDVVESFDDEE